MPDAALLEHGGGLAAFALTGGRELAQRLVDERHGARRELGRIDGRLGEDTGPAQYLVDRERGHVRHHAGDLGRRCRQLADLGLVDGEPGCRSLGAIERYAALDLAASHGGRQRFAYGRLDGSHLVGQPERDVEEAMVDRAQLDR
jgi:hypothetical protein